MPLKNATTTTRRAGGKWWALGHGHWVELRHAKKAPKSRVMTLIAETTEVVASGSRIVPDPRLGWIYEIAPSTECKVKHTVHLPRFQGKPGKFILAHDFLVKFSLPAPPSGCVMSLPERLSGTAQELVRLPFSI